MSETLRATFRRVLRLENRRRGLRHGRLEHVEELRSDVLGNERRITVYLPPGYDDHPGRRYPVLYMQDGQNLFEPERAFVPGKHWKLAEAADAVIGERTASPFIIVGVDHAGEARADEYTPVRDAKHGAGGRAEDYGRMLQTELMPRIDAAFRTAAGPASTAIGGSSLGGLLALHLALTRTDLFGAAAAMSPSVWWAGRAVLATAATFQGERPRLWLDIGGREGAEALGDARSLRDVLVARGWGDRLRFYEDRRGDHSEPAWARRSRQVLEFLFPPS